MSKPVTNATHNDWLFEHDLSRSIVETLSGVSDPRSRAGVDFCRGAILRKAILSKFANPSKAASSERKRRAYDKLRQQELINRETNSRLVNTSEFFIGSVSLSSILYTAKQEIDKILESFSIREVQHNASFTSGASTTRKRVDAQQQKKFSTKSSANWRVAEMLVASYYRDDFNCYEFSSFFHEYDVANPGFPVPIHNHNEIFTVPKNNDIDRCAAKEPDWNMFLQKGLGTTIRKRLRKAGIDLNDQSINRDLARQASIDGSLATVDLASASDSITVQLVKNLFSPDWLDFILAIRSEFGILDKKTVKWEMLSTMGNGFTFELESLIFYSLLLSLKYHFGVKGKVSVYGDDLIVPIALIDPLLSLFPLVGFQINQSKSFWTGSFRESCGGHFISGVDVTPFYIRKPIDDIHELINVINQFRLWSCRDGFGLSEHFQLWKKLTLLIPKSLRKSIVGGGDVDQRSYICAYSPFKGGIMEVSKTLPFRYNSIDEVAAYNSFHWFKNLTKWEGYLRRTRPNSFGTFSTWQEPKGFCLVLKDELIEDKQADFPKYKLAVNDGHEYRGRSLQSNNHVYLEEIILLDK